MAVHPELVEGPFDKLRVNGMGEIVPLSAAAPGDRYNQQRY